MTKKPIYLVVLAIALAVGLGCALGETPDEWLKLVVEIDKNYDRLDNDERQFIRYMANYMTAKEIGEPTPPQQHWLRNIKKRLKLP